MTGAFFPARTRGLGRFILFVIYLGHAATPLRSKTAGQVLTCFVTPDCGHRLLIDSRIVGCSPRLEFGAKKRTLMEILLSFPRLGTNTIITEINCTARRNGSGTPSLPSLSNARATKPIQLNRKQRNRDGTAIKHSHK